MRTIITVLFLVIFLLLSLPFLGIEWIIGKINPHHADLVQLRVVQWAFRCIAAISGVKLEVIGKENIPTDEPVLYVGNHRGFFDIVLTYALCPGITGYISKNSIKKVPILGLWMSRLHCLFMDRDDIKQSLKVILSAIEEVKNGTSICIFPEGTRNKDKEHPSSVLPFKEGSFKIATKTGCKIVPIAISGTDQILENHFPWIKSTKVILQYGVPIDPKELSKDEQKKIGAYCQTIVEHMLSKQLS